MKIIVKEVFDNLLKENKEAALEELKDHGRYLDEIQIGRIQYKIFPSFDYELFVYETDILPKNYAAICVDKTYYNQFKRTNFRCWYFLDEVNFTNSIFDNVVYFSNSIFAGDLYLNSIRFDDETYFSDTEFFGQAYFDRSQFAGKLFFNRAKFHNKAIFIKAEFNGDVFFAKTTFGGETNYEAAKFKEIVDFEGATFCEKLSFRKTIFKERCYLEVEKFGNYVNFTGVEFRASLLINGKKLCEVEKKLSKPTKLITFDKEGKKKFEETKENLHSVKQIFNKIADYDAEDHFYYWYKVYELKSKPRLFVPRPLDWLFLDKITGYFTKPWRVLWAIVFTISFFCILYCLPCSSIKGGAKEEILFRNLNFSLQSFDNIKLFFEHFGATLYSHWGDALYFSAITFATIGYGDYQPVSPWAMRFAAVEGIIGILLMSTFLVTLTRKVLR